jgi:hypothetical protein
MVNFFQKKIYQQLPLLLNFSYNYPHFSRKEIVPISVL